MKRPKHVIAYILKATFIIASGAMFAPDFIFAQEKNYKDIFLYREEGKGIRIVRYIGKESDVEVPSKIDGKEVTTIGESAFEGCSGLTSITIPASVTTIGKGSFRDCSSLTSITIPTGVTAIGEGAFSGCKNISISGHKKTYAEEYAERYKIPFIPID